MPDLSDVHELPEQFQNMTDRACALCERPRLPDEPTRFGAYWYHLNEPDWVCDRCASGQPTYIPADFIPPTWPAATN